MHTLIKNGMLLSTFTIATLPLSYVIRLLLTQQLSLEEFGLLFALIGFFGVLQSINDFGFSETQLYFIPRFLVQGRDDKVKATLKVQLINQILTTLIIGIILSFTAGWVSQTVFHSSEITTIFRLFILYFVFADFLQNIYILFLSYQETVFHATQEPLRIILTITSVGLAIALYKLDLLVVTWIWVGVYAALSVGYFLVFMYLHRKMLRARYYSPIKIYREFIPFLLPTLMANNVAALFSRGTETMLVLLRGLADNGLYNIAKPISNLALAFTSPIASLLKPYISQINGLNDEGAIRRVLAVILNFGVFLLLPFSVILMFYSKESIVLLFGDEYIAASITLKLIAFEIFFNTLNTFVFSIVFGLGLQKSRAKIIYVSSAVSFVIALLLIPLYGPAGVAAANIAYAVIALFGALYIIKQKVSFNFPIINYIKIAILVLILVVSQVLLKYLVAPNLSYQLALFFLKVTLGLALYYGLGIFVFDIIDLKQLTSIVKNNLPPRIRLYLSLGK